MYYILNPDELAHYGVQGMKWGVRRYQNPDGTLTEAGKRRYSHFEKAAASQEKNARRGRDIAQGRYDKAKKRLDEMAEDDEYGRAKQQKKVEKKLHAVREWEQYLKKLENNAERYYSLDEIDKRHVDRGYNLIIASGVMTVPLAGMVLAQSYVRDPFSIRWNKNLK